MTEAEQFLTELESYSKRAMMQPGDSSDMYESMDAFQGVANPVAHIAANSPDVVTADIDEILRLRVEVGRRPRHGHARHARPPAGLLQASRRRTPSRGQTG